MRKSYVDITYRDVAKMLASALPVEAEEFGLKVEEYLAVIKAMPTHQKQALKIAYDWSRKVPKVEREDFFQDVAVTLFEAQADERLAYTIARYDWRDWWRKYTIRQHYSLDSVTNDAEGNPVTLGELLVGEVEFEIKVNGKLDAELLFNKLPDTIKPLVTKRLIGYALTQTERKQMSRFVQKQGTQLLLQ